PSPGTSRLVSGLPLLTKQDFVVGDAITFTMSLHARRKRRRAGEATSRPSSSAITASRHVGDARYAPPAAMPQRPHTRGPTTNPTMDATTASEAPTPIVTYATPL